MTSSPLLAPVVALALWTHVILVWMYATRLPAMRAARMRPDPMATRGAQMSTLPARVRWKADNYNHLMEQPTVFYAVAIVLALATPSSTLDLALAWTYVGLRIAHSLFQVLINKIEVRFLLFISSALVLIVLTIDAALAVM
ncbi:MAG: MAPEG family protein [Myxococcales bacterium]|nr:MAPEG family protein [Myxococcales bacterium]MCB9715628.1 MAPEG family protein [Myxococcales bacterium]